MTYHVQFPGLGLEFTLDRVAFTVFGMPIYWYGILIATGLALAIVFAFSHARRFGIDSDRMVDVILIGTVCAVIGGRAFYVATAPFEYASFAEMLDIRLGGVAIYGAVIAAFLSGYFACRWRKVPILPMFDLAGMGFLLGQGIGRWGNFVNQEAFGTNTTLPWGMYSEGTCNYLSSVQETLAAQGVAVDPSLPVHPTFLYESIWCLLGFFLLWAYMKRRKFHGELILMYVMWYGAERFFVEGLRTDSLMVGSFRISQVIAAASLVRRLCLCPGLGHKDTFMIADGGMPIPKGVEIVDLARCGGVPSFRQVMDAVLDETEVEFYTLAEEIREKNPELLAYIKEKLPDVESEMISHLELKDRSKNLKFAIRTGEFTPYPNIILRAGVAFPA